METYRLICHPDTPAKAVTGVRVEWIGAGVLRWVVEGAGALVVPARADRPERTDGLWQTTCCEMFLKGDEGYREINLSPSGNWAAYGFDGYRSGMAPAPLAPPVIEMIPGETFTMTARLSPDVTRGATHAGLTAVIEEDGGHKSYWALAHPDGKPDFHVASCFILPLGAAQHP